MNVAIYARKSKLVIQSDSIENQIQLCKDYCIRHFDTSNIFTYSDNGFSGKNTERPGFQKMLEEIEINKIDYIVTYKLDRLCRSVRDFIDLVELFDNIDVKFTSVKENFDLDNNTGKMMALIYSMFSQIERESISERIRDNMYQSARTGRWLGGPAPLGYKFYKTLENNKSITYLTLDDQTSYIIEDLYTKFLQFKSLTKVRNYAYRTGIAGPKGNPLDLTTIGNILRNPVYVKSSPYVVEFLKNSNLDVFGEPDGIHGILTYGKKNILSIKPVASISKHPGLIDSENWLKVQSLLIQNSEKFPRQGSGKKALLSGLLKCKICGSNMRISYKKNKNTGIEHSYYICGKKKQIGTIACNCSNLNSNFIDGLVLDSLGNINTNELINLFDKNYISDYNLDSNQKELNLLQKNIKNKTNNLNSLTNKLSLTDNQIVLNTIINKMETLANEPDDLNAKYTYLENKISTVDYSHVKDIDYSINNFKLFIENQSIDKKRDLLNNLIQSITWDPDSEEINIIYK